MTSYMQYTHFIKLHTASHHHANTALLKKNPTPWTHPICRYEDMSAAVSEDIEQVWAVIEIKPEEKRHDMRDGYAYTPGAVFGSTYDYADNVRTEGARTEGGEEWDFVAASYRHRMGRGGNCARFTRSQVLAESAGSDGSNGPAGLNRNSTHPLLPLDYLSPLTLNVRMHPSAIPDTRNFEFSPLKAGSPRMQVRS